MKKGTNKTKKRVFYILDFGRRKEFAAYLEKMAQEGWMFVKKKGGILYFEACTPKTMHFCVEFFNQSSDYETELTSDTEECVEMCEKAGWHLVQCAGKEMIFCSELSDPMPIQTDSRVEFEEACKYLRRDFFPVFFLLAVVVADMLMFTSDDSTLADKLIISNDMDWPLLFIIISICWLPEIIQYFCFRRRNKERAANGENLIYFNSGRLYLVERLLAVVVIVLYFLIMYPTDEGKSAAIFFVILIAVIIAPALLIEWVREGNTKLPSEPGKLLLFIPIIFAFFVVVLGNDIFLAEQAHREEIVTYTNVDGTEDSESVYHDDIPITLQALGVHIKGAAHKETSSEEHHTAFGRYGEYSQTYYDKHMEEFDEDMTYSLLQSKFKAIVNSQLKEYLSDDETKWKEIKNNELKLWGADKAYIGEDSEDQGNVTYRIVKWKDKVFWFSGVEVKMTKENIQRIKKKLKL